MYPGIHISLLMSLSGAGIGIQSSDVYIRRLITVEHVMHLSLKRLVSYIVSGSLIKDEIR